MAARLMGEPMPELSELSMIGAMAKYISAPTTEKLTPMNANFGLLPPLPERVRDKKKKALAMAYRALEALGMPYEIQSQEEKP